MEDWREVAANYRSPNRADYPELDGYTRDEIYEDCMGGGALYLAARMARTVRLNPDSLVLDLGCGKGTTSLFWAERFGARVVAVDLWIDATFLDRKFAVRGYRDQILPLQLDATARLPFANEAFDAIFCMNSLSFYGGSVGFLQHLLKHLKKGGQFVAGMETFNGEFSPEERQNPPPVFNYNLPPQTSIPTCGMMTFPRCIHRRGGKRCSVTRGCCKWNFAASLRMRKSCTKTWSSTRSSTIWIQPMFKLRSSR